jgi:hypothetical protein
VRALVPASVFGHGALRSDICGRRHAAEGDPAYPSPSIMRSVAFRIACRFCVRRPAGRPEKVITLTDVIATTSACVARIGSRWSRGTSRSP